MVDGSRTETGLEKLRPGRRVSLEICDAEAAELRRKKKAVADNDSKYVRDPLFFRVAEPWSPNYLQVILLSHAFDRIMSPLYCKPEVDKCVFFSQTLLIPVGFEVSTFAIPFGSEHGGLAGLSNSDIARSGPVEFDVLAFSNHLL